ncbi:3-deoxy-manno-octulosonate cytidylyltransferase [Novosphingobium sp. YJ-S2-02]|uniref:3-deoxy-manno-octulosonate cytidylyltransferase n=1 Tax=Novosphingobium aureum TaxID=2792964 RepID=A0A931HGT7_9SPHN|nr:manno-octulosonate cytidylyltransferase [Novosphingobium aureum]MBH0115056.1 3-deoxy-manno-octulosonate cytidylyltransferase [Novosphingobium aureum]
MADLPLAGACQPCEPPRGDGAVPLDNLTAQSCATIIPARFASSRYPGKPLVPLTGASGECRSLIRRTWDRAREATGAGGLWVATDDARIAHETRGFGGACVMTSRACANGTERCAEAVARLGSTAHFVVNFQGDAPLMPAGLVARLVALLRADPEAAMATAAVRASPQVHARMLDDAARGLSGATTVVTDRAGRALYFSRHVLPFGADPQAARRTGAVRIHLGLYVYRRSALDAYRAASPCASEMAEGLEQLRFLDMGMTVRVLTLDALEWDAIELNNPGDEQRIEQVLREQSIA